MTGCTGKGGCMARAKSVPDAIISKLTSGHSRLSIILWTVTKRPKCFIIPFLVLLVMVGLGSYGVIWGSRLLTSKQQDEAMITAQSTLSAIVQTIEISYGPLIAIRERILANPSWPKFNAEWDNMTLRLISDAKFLSGAKLINDAKLIGIQVAPQGVISAVFPFHYLNQSLGVDLLDSYPAGILEQVTWGVLGLQGPLVTAQGDWSMMTSLPVFIPSDDRNLDFGDIQSRGECSVSRCNENGQTFWGTIYAILLIQPLAQSLISLNSIMQQGWKMEVVRVVDLTPQQIYDYNFASNATLFQVNGPMGHINPISVRSNLIKGYSPAESSVALELRLSPAKDWGGEWWGGGIAAVVVASLLASALIFVSMVSRAQEEFILYSILPPKVVNVMRQGESFVAQGECTLIFADVVGFTSISSRWSPQEVAAFISELSFLFERECCMHGMHKIDLIGDCLFAGCGILEAEDPVSGALKAVKTGIGLLNGCKGVITHDGTPIRLRIGVHQGDCVTTVVGLEFPKLTVFGDNVNIASRMESSGRPMEIHISETVANRLREAGLKENGLSLKYRGKVELKNRGEMGTYWVQDASDPSVNSPRDGPSRSFVASAARADCPQFVGIEISEQEAAPQQAPQEGRASLTLPHTFSSAGLHFKTGNSFWGRSSLTSRNPSVLRAIVCSEAEDDQTPSSPPDSKRLGQECGSPSPEGATRVSSK